jgi:hypothetical protein
VIVRFVDIGKIVEVFTIATMAWLTGTPVSQMTTDMFHFPVL